MYIYEQVYTMPRSFFNVYKVLQKNESIPTYHVLWRNFDAIKKITSLTSIIERHTKKGNQKNTEYIHEHSMFSPLRDPVWPTKLNLQKIREPVKHTCFLCAYEYIKTMRFFVRVVIKIVQDFRGNFKCAVTA